MNYEEKNKFRSFATVIYDCNDNCISCPVPRKENRINPELEEIKKQVDKILKSSDHVEINGGEPMLRKDLLRILKYIDKKNPKYGSRKDFNNLRNFKTTNKKISRQGIQCGIVSFSSLHTF
jgi:MoaA/NifB/PqqE/SkfB family radical SAM enzyme